MSQKPIEMIKEFDELNVTLKMQKLNTAGQYAEIREEEQAILDAYRGNSNFRRHCSVVGVMDDIAIVQDDDSYHPMVKEHGQWVRVGRYYPTVHLAILGALGYKYDGLNSQFDYFAMRMLGINPAE